MLTFITSLPHPWNCHSYDRVLDLLDMTVSSILKQTDTDMSMVVVCNEAPKRRYPRCVHALEVSFPPPSSEHRPTTGMGAIRLDRGCKYTIGVCYARRFNPSHIMFVDADDLVSKRVSRFVHEHDPDQGWYVETGYRHRLGASRVAELSSFFKSCGTSIIHPADHLMGLISGAICETTPQDVIIDQVDRRTLLHLLGSHRFAPDFYAGWGRPLKPLPFAAAVWVLGTGENHSGRQGEEGDIPLSSELISEFGFRSSEFAFP